MCGYTAVPKDSRICFHLIICLHSLALNTFITVRFCGTPIEQLTMVTNFAGYASQ